MATTSRQRVPAAQRRDALIDAAVEEFAHGGLHATPVDRIARRVGVAQPYVFSLFPTKKDLFLAAVQRGFERVGEQFAAAPELTPAGLGDSYVQLLQSDRNLLLLQLHAYAAAAADEEIAVRVRELYDAVIDRARELTQADDDALAMFSAQGAWLNMQAALNPADLEDACGWMQRLGDRLGEAQSTERD